MLALSGLARRMARNVPSTLVTGSEYKFLIKLFNYIFNACVSVRAHVRNSAGVLAMGQVFFFLVEKKLLSHLWDV